MHLNSDTVNTLARMSTLVVFKCVVQGLIIADLAFQLQ